MAVSQFKTLLLLIAAILAVVVGYSFLSDRIPKEIPNPTEKEIIILRNSLAYNLRIKSARDVLASACSRYYAENDPIAEARSAVGKSPYIYLAFHYASEAGMNAPGFEECQFDYNDNERDFEQKRLDYFDAIEWDDIGDQFKKTGCIQGAYEYGKKFNQAINRMRPRFFKQACQAKNANPVS